MSKFELFGWVGVMPLALTYVLAAPGLVYLRRRGLARTLAWWLPLLAICLWWLLYESGFGMAGGYNAIELVIVAVAVAVGIDLCAVFVMPMVRIPRWSGVLFWSVPLVFVIVLRLLMPSLGE